MVKKGECHVIYRRSFEEFNGSKVANNISDATNLAFFRERFRKAGVLEEFFERLSHIFAPKDSKPLGQIMDVTLAPLPLPTAPVEQ